jgi:hypothetical protein
VLGPSVHAPFRLWTDLARTQRGRKWSVKRDIHQTPVRGESTDCTESVRIRWGSVKTSYNSKANGIVERMHWDVRQSLFKAVGGDNKKWFYFFHHVMWANHITVRKGTGCSPYFMITRAHPTLPLDIVKATWLVKLPDRTLSTSEIIGYCAQALAKHVQHVGDMWVWVDLEKWKRLLKYKEEHVATIKYYNFKPGSLVLIRNTEIEKSLNKKMKA